ncbi:hypothetical protein BDV93DRAFT_565899 [Ceratobasidium sp. AG-I]|nr:hypothetical protein BDV93DRAFT_565899 [Ceratobasidium sp. AG-I]
MVMPRLVSALHTWVLSSAASGMVVGIIDRTTISLSHELLVSFIPSARHESMDILEYGARPRHAPLNHPRPRSIVSNDHLAVLLSSDPSPAECIVTQFLSIFDHILVVDLSSKICASLLIQTQGMGG